MLDGQAEIIRAGFPSLAFAIHPTAGGRIVGIFDCLVMEFLPITGAHGYLFCNHVSIKGFFVDDSKLYFRRKIGQWPALVL